MIVARIVDMDGVTWTEMALPTRVPYIELPARTRIFKPVTLDSLAELVPMRTIRAEHERVTGDGIHIYRIRRPW